MRKKRTRRGISLVEMMIATMVLGVGIVVVAKMFGQGGYIVGKSKWELYAMSIANGEIERVNLYAGRFEQIETRAYKWVSLSNADPEKGQDYLAAKALSVEIPDDLVNAEFQKRVQIQLVNDFLAEVVVSVKWEENTSSGRKQFQMNVPTLISNPKPFREYE